MLKHELKPTEVWGGNRCADSAVASSGLDAWVYSNPYGESDGGGDVYYVSSCATGRITRMLVADLAGHRQAVTDIAADLRTLMRRHVNQIDQSRLVQSMNQQFASLFGDGCFATALVTTFFAPTNHLSLCNAGHPPPLLYRAALKQWSFLDQHCAGGIEFADVPLVAMDMVNYDQFDVKLNVNDLVLCYTDSLIEALDQRGEALGLAGLLDIVRDMDVSEASRVVPQLMSAVGRHRGNEVNDDDLTVVLLSPNGCGSRVPLRERLLGPVRMMKNFLTSLQGREPMAWPEWSLANLGGLLFGPLNRRWSQSRTPYVLATRVYSTLPDPATVRIAQPRVARRSAMVDVVVSAVESRVAVAAVEAESATAAPLNVNSAA
jgi:sigma-B regulation protein RsbU (phosphoserine phosphatase)